MEEQKQSNGSRFAMTVRRAANLPAEGWADERIAAIARTVAPPEAGPAEVGMFLAVASRYNLDPFLKEIWLVKDKGRLMVLTGRDSFLKTARQDPAYEGYRSGAVHENDEFVVEHDDTGVRISHKIKGWDRGKLAAAYSVVYVKDRPPVLIIRKLDDYKHLHNKDNWRNNPEDMLLSRVITASHRLAFNISGIYTPDEAADREFQEGALDEASSRAATGTKNQLEELKAKLARKKAQVEQEKTEVQEVQEVQDAEYEIVQDEPEPEEEAPEKPIADPDFSGEFGVELPDWDKDSSIPANPDDDPEAAFTEPKAGETEEKSSYERAKGAYFAAWNELWKEGLGDTPPLAQYMETKEEVDSFRADWQEEHLEKRSASRFSEDDFRKAADMLKAGIGLHAPSSVGNAQGGLPV